MHVFCDASETGYGACIYVVGADEKGGRRATLLSAKSEVAPLKAQSIPRLELCAALLGCKLMKAVSESLSKLSLRIERFYAWTDSTIVLSWLAAEANCWSTFVANRVAKIQEIDFLEWNHVGTHDNPADIASRGIDPSKLKNCSLWWSGPQWLTTENFPEPFLPQGTSEEKKHCARTNRTLATQLQESKDHSGDVINLREQIFFRKTLRIVVQIRRFIDKCKRKKTNCSNFPTPTEMQEALETLLRQEQYKFLSTEIKTLETETQVKPQSKLSKPYPFLHEGILCVGGRLAQADLPDETKYPRLIPEKSELARLVILDAHHSTLHGRATQTIAQIRTRFWIPGCRNQVRKLILNCVTCSPFIGNKEEPLMGDLPKERISIPTRAFEDVGLDFGGPFYLKVSGSENNKAYLALFVCFASKAIHLKLVSDLTTNACIAALRLFTSRRGCPRKMYSDNATNFTGSQSELEKLQKNLNAKYQDSLQAAAAGLLIEWNFIPPNAPHFGGLWEAGIKSAKHHLGRTMRNHVLTFEELTTLFCQVESILNSRPIGVLSEDPKDGEILTPAHLICERNSKLSQQ